MTKTGPAGTSLLQLIITIQSTAVVTDKTLLALAGTLTGAYSVGKPMADLGGVYHFTGTGNAGTLGAVTIVGNISLPGFIATGHASGMLTLTNALGSVTLQLSGPLEAGFGAFPATLVYLLKQGTGTYAGDVASGTISVTLVPDTTAKGGGGGFTFVIP